MQPVAVRPANYRASVQGPNNNTNCAAATRPRFHCHQSVALVCVGRQQLAMQRRLHVLHTLVQAIAVGTTKLHGSVTWRRRWAGPPHHQLPRVRHAASRVVKVYR